MSHFTTLSGCNNLDLKTSNPLLVRSSIFLIWRYSCFIVITTNHSGANQFTDDNAIKNIAIRQPLPPPKYIAPGATQRSISLSWSMRYTTARLSLQT